MHLFILLCLTLAGSAASAAEADESSTHTSSGAHPQIFDLPETDGEAVLIVLDERGRNLKLTLLDGQNRRLAEFDTPGMSLGRLVVLVEFAEYPAARAVAVGPVRESSSAGTFTLSFSSLPPGEVEVARAVSVAAREYAGAVDRSVSITAFENLLELHSPWQDWIVYWAALVENEYGSREKALELLRRFSAADSTALTTLLRRSLEGQIHIFLGNLERADKLLDEVIYELDRRAEAHPLAFEFASIAAREYHCVVLVYLKRGATVCEDALADAERLGDPYLIGLLHIDSAAHEVLNNGRPEQALPHVQAAVWAFTQAGTLFNHDAGNAYLSLASVQEQLGRFSEAKLAIQSALALLPEAQGQQTNVGWAYHRAAELYNLTGDYDRAAVYGENAVRVLKKTGDRELAARAAAALTEVYIASKSADLAQRHAADALAYYVERCDAEYSKSGSCGLASEYRKALLHVALAMVLEPPTDAERSQSLATAERALSGLDTAALTKQDTASFELKYADLLSMLGRFEQADQRLDIALRLYDEVDDSIGRIETLSRRAELRFDSGRFALALLDAEQATARLSDFELRLAAERMGPALRAKLFDQFGLRIAAQFAIHRGQSDNELAQTVFDIAVESLGPGSTLEKIPADVVLDGLLSDLSMAMRGSAADEQVGESPTDSAVVAPDTLRANAAVALALDAIEAYFLAHGSVQMRELTPITKQTLQQALEPDEALLHYVWWRDSGWVVVVERNALNVHEIGQLSTAALSEYVALVGQQSQPVTGYALWETLSENLLPPLSPGITRLYVIPDGPLHVLPLGALPLLDGSLQPVLSRYVVSYISSYDGFSESIDRSVDMRRGAAIFANPILVGQAHSGVRQNAPPRQSTHINARASWFERLAPLPQAEQEAHHIEALLGSEHTQVFVGSAASKDQLRDGNTRNKSIWHFATHGYFSSDFAAIAGLVLAQVDDNNQRRDGLFTTQDARALSTQADLVVLNGCETGLGATLQGEGVMGFTRTFIGSGVSNTISTVWNVPDRAANEIMVEFYKELIQRDGSDVATALVMAQRKYLERHGQHRRRPKYWGGYIHHQY